MMKIEKQVKRLLDIKRRNEQALSGIKSQREKYIL